MRVIRGDRKRKKNKLESQKELVFSQLFRKEIKHYWYHVEWAKFLPSDNKSQYLFWRRMTGSCVVR